jgi:hypothetical protein
VAGFSFVGLWKDAEAGGSIPDRHTLTHGSVMVGGVHHGYHFNQEDQRVSLASAARVRVFVSTGSVQVSAGQKL